MLSSFITKYNEAVYDTDRDRALSVIDDALANQVSAEEIVFGIIIPAMESMVKNMENEDFDSNLAQHFMASQIAAEVVDKMIVRFKQTPESVGRVVIGTSYGDFHSLGKRIVIGCLKAMTIDVIDLGTNVMPERFVEEAIKNNAQIIAISSMMLHTARGENGCIAVRKLLKEKNLEGRFKIIVGGAPYRFDPQLYKLVGADATAPDGVTAGKVIGNLIQEVLP